MDAESKKDIEEKASRAAYLIFRYLNNALTEEEDHELAVWMVQNEQNWKIFEEFTGEEYNKKFGNRDALN